jgi:MYXO-CTERM domain-containing protein
MSRAWLAGVAAVLGLVASCDKPVPDDGPVPPGEIQPVKVSALAPTTSDIVPNNDIVPQTGPADIIADCNISGCPISTDPCNTFACNSATGVCDLKAVNDGGQCDDGNLCTRGDTCSSGVCRPGNPITCPPASDQCHNQGTCDPSSGACTNPPKPDGTSCNDGKTCTSGDRCTGGACMGFVNCPGDQCHDAGSCNANGACTNPPKADNTPCNDSSMCTQTDVCIGGTCRGQNPKPCNTPPNQCYDSGSGSCDPMTGNCMYQLKSPGTPCNDNMLCTWGDACNNNGGCVGTMISCVSDQYADRTCNGTQTCTVTPKPGASCDDHNPCTKGDVLSANGACAGMAYTCPVTSCLTANACDGLGGCMPTAKMDGTSCDADGSKCTPMDRCQGGTCIKDPNPVTCVRKDCNTASCDPATGNCQYQPTSGGDCGVTGCYSRGTCSNGTCSGTPKDCSGFDGPCTTGVCDVTSGGCVATPKSNGTSCDPGGLCATGAVCAFGECQLAPTSCPAPSGPCKLPTCDPATGACQEANKAAGASCDPKTPCMTAGVCDDQGRCLGSPAPMGDSCTRAGGALGVCLAGQCEALGDIVPSDAGDPDGGSKLNGSKSGCGCVTSPASQGAAGLLAIGALAMALGRRRRRR